VFAPKSRTCESIALQNPGWPPPRFGIRSSRPPLAKTGRIVELSVRYLLVVVFLRGEIGGRVATHLAATDLEDVQQGSGLRENLLVVP